MLPSIDIIIVNWNSANQLRECLESIVDTNHHNFRLDRVVIVDNASTDQSLTEIENINLPLTIIKNLDNKGFGFACNQGAASSNSNYLLFLNPDTKLFKDSLDKPVNFMENSLKQRIGVVGIQLVDSQGEIQRSCTRFPTLTNFWCNIIGIDKVIANKFTSYLMREWDHTKTEQVDQVMGAFYLIRRDVFRALNGFDETFFVYFEDLDLSYRLSKSGWSSYYLTNVQSFHKGCGTSNNIKSTRLFYFVRSRILYVYKHFNFAQASIILLASIFVEPLTRIGFSLLKLSFSEVKETILAYRQLIATSPELYKQIQQIQQQRT